MQKKIKIQYLKTFIIINKINKDNNKFNNINNNFSFKVKIFISKYKQVNSPKDTYN